RSRCPGPTPTGSARTRASTPSGSRAARTRWPAGRSTTRSCSTGLAGRGRSTTAPSAPRSAAGPVRSPAAAPAPQPPTPRSAGLEAVGTGTGRVGGLISGENFMPLARVSLYESGVEVYLAPTAEDSEECHDSMKHIARESRAFVLSCCVYQRASSYPDDVQLA